jgi:crotonobetaine/carnitine-CoA ligase
MMRWVSGVPSSVPKMFADMPTWTYEELTTQPGSDDDVLVMPRPSDIACIMYTSRTTGPAKGVLMPHAHCYLFGYGMAGALDMTESNRYYVCMPLFHANALLMQVVGALIVGASIYCVERFSPNRRLQEVRASGATLTNALGVMPEFIFRTAPTSVDRDHALRLMMAIPISAEWGEALEERFGLKIVQG